MKHYREKKRKEMKMKNPIDERPATPNAYIDPNKKQMITTVMTIILTGLTSMSICQFFFYLLISFIQFDFFKFSTDSFIIIIIYVCSSNIVMKWSSHFFFAYTRSFHIRFIYTILDRFHSILVDRERREKKSGNKKDFFRIIRPLFLTIYKKKTTLNWDIHFKKKYT